MGPFVSKGRSLRVCSAECRDLISSIKAGVCLMLYLAMLTCDVCRRLREDSMDDGMDCRPRWNDRPRGRGLRVEGNYAVSTKDRRSKSRRMGARPSTALHKREWAQKAIKSPNCLRYKTSILYIVSCQLASLQARNGNACNFSACGLMKPQNVTTPKSTHSTLTM